MDSVGFSAFTHPNFPNPTFCSPVSFRCAQWSWHFNITTHIQTPSCAVLSSSLPLDTSKLSSVQNPCSQTRWRSRVLCPDLFVKLRWYNDTFVTRSQQRCSASKIGSDGRGHAQSLTAAAQKPQQGRRADSPGETGCRIVQELLRVRCHIVVRPGAWRRELLHRAVHPSIKTSGRESAHTEKGN